MVGDEGTEMSTTSRAPPTVVTYAYSPLRATPDAGPDRVPTTTGTSGVDQSTTCNPSVTSATTRQSPVAPAATGIPEVEYDPTTVGTVGAEASTIHTAPVPPPAATWTPPPAPRTYPSPLPQEPTLVRHAGEVRS
jgi:hypothetical protein